MPTCHPFIIAAQTLDGFIAAERDQSSFEWTSREDKKWYSQQTKAAGCVIFGRTTFETFNRPIPGCLNLVYTRSQPEEFATADMAELTAQRQAKETILLRTQLSPEKITQRLGEIGYKALSVSGGGSVYHQFLASGVVEKLLITIEPVVFGQGVKLFSEAIPTKLSLEKIHDLSHQTKCLEYSVVAADGH